MRYSARGIISDVVYPSFRSSNVVIWHLSLDDDILPEVVIETLCYKNLIRWIPLVFP